MRVRTLPDYGASRLHPGYYRCPPLAWKARSAASGSGRSAGGFFSMLKRLASAAGGDARRSANFTA